MDKGSRCALRPFTRRDAGRRMRIQNGPINSRLCISEAAFSHPVLMQQQVLAQKQHNWICFECLLKGLPVLWYHVVVSKPYFFGKPCKSLISWRCTKRWKRWEPKAPCPVRKTKMKSDWSTLNVADMRLIHSPCTGLSLPYWGFHRALFRLIREVN